ncbi:MAG: DUF1501 domain-containing protein [Planctomycetaceae bacterium]|nr:DUF1501 domain-containing protein [Planctomycetaceae bacterium]
MAFDSNRISNCSLPGTTNHACCSGPSRRQALQAGGLSALGLTLPQLLNGRKAAAQSPPQTDHAPGFGKAKSVLLFWLLGGPPQHETWDPKPNAPAEIRGEFGAIETVVPGIQIGELMPRTASLVDQLAILRAVVTKDQAHSSSGYQMLTGVPHIPLSQENVTARLPNLAPSQAAIMRALRPDRDGLPSAIRLPRHIANDGEIVWPGQDAGMLGRKFDPWLLTCDPSLPDFRVPDLAFPDDISSHRFDRRRELLSQLDDLRLRNDSRSAAGRFTAQTSQAFDLLSGGAARRAFSLHEEPDSVRDRYGRYRFGQSMLLARRLIEAGVSLVQVNWTRVENSGNNGSWDTHKNHFIDLKGFLMPMMDQTFTALLEDLQQRGLLDETLVVWVGEFGHTPKINGNAGRDHWGNCFSIAMAGAGIRGGIVHGESDGHAAYPVSGIVSPADITATIFHSLGYSPDTMIEDQTGRPMPITRGHVIREILV